MINSLLDKLTALLVYKKFIAIVGGALAFIIVASVLLIGGHTNSSNGSGVLSATKQNASNTSGASSNLNNNSNANSFGANNSSPTNSSANPNKPAGSIAGTAQSSTASNNGSAPAPTVAQTMPTTTVVKTTVNADQTTTKEIVDTKPVSFASETQNEVNLKRGDTSIVQAGQNGVRTIVYTVTYDKDGKEISRVTKSDSITTQPVSQITKVGVSDFNLNTDTWEGTEFGEACYPGDYKDDPAADGCVGVPSNAHFSAVNLSGVQYVTCFSYASGVCRNDSFNLSAVIPFSTSNTFFYGGAEYRADPRAGGGVPEMLTSSVCAQYNLACGTW